MSLAAIIGAGEIGGATARLLAARGRFDTVRLIDDQQHVAAGKALDLRQSGALTRSDTRLEGAADLAAAGGAAAIVLADQSALGSEWHGEQGLATLRRLAALGCLETAILICAGPTQCTLMEQGFFESGLSRRRVVGSAPEALAATARALVALEAHIGSPQVSLTVIGRPPDRMVIPWSTASAAGQDILSALAPPQLNQIERRARGLWPPGPGSLGAAAALFSEAALAGSRNLFSAFVSLDRDNGTKAPVCAWPVSIGPQGLVRVASPGLTARDRTLVDEVLQ
jgi:malate dehydrogenase